MKTDSPVDMKQQLGADRVLAPAGALPQPAERLDASGPVRPVRVRGRGRAPLPRLHLLPQHPRALRRRSGANGRAHPRDRRRSAARCTTPRPTRAAWRSARSPRSASATASPPQEGQRIVTLASLTLTPLRLEAVTRLDPDDPQVEVTRHRLRLRPLGLGPGPRRPAARDRARGLRRLRRRLAHAHARAGRPARSACSVRATPASWLSPPRATRCTAARSWRSTSTRPRSPASSELGLCDIGVTADLRDPLGRGRGAAGRRRAAGRPDRGRRQRQRLRADRDPAHGRLRHGPVLLDGDQLLDGRPDGRRHGVERPHAGRQRLHARTSAPTRSTWCAARPALREALGV